MTYETLIQQFGSPANAARALSVSRQAISAWKRRGVPPLRAFQIEAVLKARNDSSPAPQGAV